MWWSIEYLYILSPTVNHQTEKHFDDSLSPYWCRVSGYAYNPMLLEGGEHLPLHMLIHCLSPFIFRETYMYIVQKHQIRFRTFMYKHVQYGINNTCTCTCCFALFVCLTLLASFFHLSFKTCTCMYTATFATCTIWYQQYMYMYMYICYMLQLCSSDDSTLHYNTHCHC